MVKKSYAIAAPIVLVAIVATILNSGFLEQPDRIENINGINIQPGGAALHAAVAAKTLMDSVRLFSVTSKDYPFTDILDNFPREHIKTSSMPSTKFNIRYDKRWEAHYLEAEHGAGSRISASTIPLDELDPDALVHISPIPPARVEKIVNAISEASPETKISVNAWTGYITGRKNRRILKELASKVDFFIMSDSEAKLLTEADSLSIALRLIKDRIALQVRRPPIGHLKSDDLRAKCQEQRQQQPPAKAPGIASRCLLRTRHKQR